ADEQAVTESAPILQGKLSCAEIPHSTFARLLVPLLRLGRAEEAMKLHRRGYRLGSTNPAFLPRAAEHLTFLVLTGNLAKAASLFARHFPWSLETAAPARRFEFHLAAHLLVQQLRDSGRQRITLRLPASFPIYRQSGVYDISALLSWLTNDLH